MHMNRFGSRTPHPGSEHGFAMILALLVLFVSGLIVAASLAATEGDVIVTKTNSNQQRAYFAALAGVDAYKYQLQQNGNYWNTCPKIESAVSVPGATAETYTYKTLPSTGHAKCESAKLTSIIDSATSASGTFHIESTGKVTGSKCGSHTCSRSIVATFTHPSFLNYAYISNYELVDPPTVGKATAECEHYYKERQEGKGASCVSFPWISEDAIEGPFHTNDAADISGSPTFGRVGHNDVVEMNEGYYGGKPTINGKGYTEEGPILLPPETGGELVNEAEIKYKGRTVIILKEGGTMEVKKNGSVSYESVPWPANGVLAIQNGPKGCGITYTPFFPSYTKDNECGDVYISGKYNEALTVIAEEDVIINGNLTAPCGAAGAEPTGAATLGLIADKYVRLYHPVKGPSVGVPNCEEGPNASCKQEESPKGSATYTCAAGIANAEANQNAATKELGAALSNPIIDAALLSTKNSWGVDNFGCGKPLGTITVWGSIAQEWRGRVTCCAAGGDYVKSYKYDPRLETLQPPDFLAPSTTTGWSVERETAPPE
jgi:Tfp pilus assembly protein PilX